MDLSLSSTRVSRRAGPAVAVAKGLPASLVLAGASISLFGLAWDAQWHSDVGPDTFFTLPHLFLYAGSAIAGLVSLYVVLVTTAAARAGRPIDPEAGGRSIGVLRGTFKAPLGYLVSGVGAASFLMYGLWDLWWHQLYGFDAVIDSPPHVGLLLSITVSMIGAVIVFAAAKDQMWSLAGLVAGAAVLLAFNTLTTLALQMLGDSVDAVGVGMAFFAVVLLLTVASLTRRPLVMVGIGVALGAVQAVLWWFAPLATRLYAASIDLPMRDFVSGLPTMAALIPMGVVLAGALMAGVLRVTRSSQPWPAPPLAGGLGGLLLTLANPVQQSLVYGVPMPEAGFLLGSGVVGSVVGVVGGFLGWRFGLMLRQLTPQEG
ncbi:hypothetical protein [Nonomuraea sp. NPDC046570]|uniref:hypothetical protein n=1 Tax=Nonomuraea sp. NPDC046570 TaxID=3155255 RepID=UPI0033EC913C